MKAELEVAVNGAHFITFAHRLPWQAVDGLAIEGDVTLQQAPQLESGNLGWNANLIPGTHSLSPGSPAASTAHLFRSRLVRRVLRSPFVSPIPPCILESCCRHALPKDLPMHFRVSHLICREGSFGAKRSLEIVLCGANSHSGALSW